MIGDNVIVGAYAVASGKLECNSVYAGNPAKRICSVEEFICRRDARQLNEAVDIFNRYCQRFGVMPDRSIFHEYFYLFSKDGDLIDLYKSKMLENGNYDDCIRYLRNHEPMFSGYESFCEYAMNNKGIYEK